MSCGKKIESNYLSRYELADRLRESGDDRYARDIEQGRCIPSYALNDIEHSLDRVGLQNHWDYDVRACPCREDDRDD